MGDRRTLMKYKILYVFEGFLFELAVVKYSDSSIKSIEVYPHFTQNVNTRAYYHHLEVLKIEVREGKHDDEISGLVDGRLVEPVHDVNIAIAKISIVAVVIIVALLYYV